MTRFGVKVGELRGLSEIHGPVMTGNDRPVVPEFAFQGPDMDRDQSAMTPSSPEKVGDTNEPGSAGMLPGAFG